MSRFSSKPEEEATFVDDKGKSKQADLCFSPPGKTFPSSDEIQRRVQQQIDDINAKRKRDTDLLNGNAFFRIYLIHLFYLRIIYPKGPRGHLGADHVRRPFKG